jgi:hypothetical protein
MKKIVFLVFFCCYTACIFAQIENYFSNHSFEALEDNIRPKEWKNKSYDADCVQMKELNFGDGKYSALLLLKPNGIEGRLVQQLNAVLEPDHQYHLIYYAAAAKGEISTRSGTKNVSGGLILRFFVCDSTGKKHELLAKNDNPIKSNWKRQELTISPKSACTHICIEVQYPEKNDPEYRGMFIDDLVLREVGVAIPAENGALVPANNQNAMPVSAVEANKGPREVIARIPLKNPSFEGQNKYGTVPEGWYDCGFPNTTPPDILPLEALSVIMEPQHGNTYLGMVVRDNGTTERVGQKLSTPLKQGKLYQLDLFLGRSDQYLSMSYDGYRQLNYYTPAKLKLYGGNQQCAMTQLLAETPMIDNFQWKSYTLEFVPNADYSYLILEADYTKPYKPAYNGNILIDNLSDIMMVVKK